MAESSLATRLRRRLSWLLVVASGVIAQLMTLVTGIISARMLGVSGRGEVAIVLAIGGTAAALTLAGGFATVLSRELAIRKLTFRDGVGPLIPRIALVATIPAVAAGVCTYVVTVSAGQATAIQLGALSAVIALQSMAYRIIIRGLLGEGCPMFKVAVAALLSQVIATAGLTAAWALGATWNSSGFLVAFAVCSQVGLTLSLRFFRPATGDAGALTGRHLWSESKRNHVASVAPLDGLSLDRIIVGATLGFTALGLYVTARAVANLVGILGSGFATVLLPRLSAAQLHPDREPRVVAMWLAVTSLLTAAAAAALAAIARPVIEFGFGEEFLPATTASYWLIGGAAAMALRRMLLIVLQARGRGGRASTAEFVITLLMVVALLQASTIVGVTIIVAAAAVLACLVLAVLVVRTRSAGTTPSSDAVVADLDVTEIERGP